MASAQVNAAALLRLTADNLFITPLDDAGQWYRYHSLFAEMLRANLDETAQHDCQRRAALWYAAQPMMPEAMRSAQAAQNYDLMAQFRTQSYKSFLGQALLVSLQKWLTALPDAYQTPRTRLAAAWCRVYESNEAELQQIVAAITAQSPELDKPFQGEILAVRAIYASLYGRFDNAVLWATEALTLIDPEDHLSLAAALDLLHKAMPQFEAAGRLRLVTEANVVQALACFAQKQEAAAQKALIRVLALAKAEG